MEAFFTVATWVAWYSQIATPLLLCSSIPLGTPPAPADPVLARMAPPQCVFYYSWAGTVAPDPASPNRAERFLADPEIQHLRSEAARRFRRLAESYLKEVDRISPPTKTCLAEAIPFFGEILTTEPGSLFLSHPPDGSDSSQFDGAIIVRIGDRQVQVADWLKRLQESTPEAVEVSGEGLSQEYHLKYDGKTPIRWALRDRYLIVTWGSESPTAISDRRTGSEPAWLTAIAQDVPMERRTAVFHLACEPLRTLLDDAAQKQPVPEAQFPPAWLVQARSVTLVTGLEGADFVGRVFVKLDEPLATALHLGVNQPLKPEHFTTIPRDATLAVAARLDARQLLVAKDCLEGASKTSALSLVLAANAAGPDVLHATAETLVPLMRPAASPCDILDPELRQELATSLGDVWCFYVSPGEGMFLFTGATLTVSVRDHDRLAKTLEALAERGRADNEESSRDWAIRKATFAHQDIYYLVHAGSDTLGTFAWCLTDETLVCATSPQNLKAYLLRKVDQASLAQEPAVAEVLQSPAPPTVMVYENTPELFRLGYPLLQCAANYINSHGSLKLDGPDPMLLPAAATIAQYLRPAVTSLQTTPQGVSLTVRQSLPSGNLGATAWVVGCAMLPAQYDSSDGGELGVEAALFGSGDDGTAPKHPPIPPANFTDVKEGPCILHPQQPFGAGQTTVEVGHELKGTCKFSLDDFFGEQMINANISLENTAQRPLQCQYNVAFFDKAGKLVGCTSQRCEKLAPGDNTSLGSCLIFLPTGAEETVDSYKVTYYECEVPAEPEKTEASGDGTASESPATPPTTSLERTATVTPIGNHVCPVPGTCQPYANAPELSLRFSETKEGTCTLTLSKSFDDQDAVVSVPLGDKLKVTYRFRLGESLQQGRGRVLCSQKEIQVPCDTPTSYECQVAFFDKAGKLLGTDRFCGAEIPPKPPSYCSGDLGDEILIIKGLAEQVASYKLIYHEFEAQETKNGASGDNTSVPLAPSISPCISPVGNAARSQVSVYRDNPPVLGGPPGQTRFFCNPTLTFSETKEGTCTLKRSQSFDDQDAVVSVPLGGQLKGTYRFRVGELAPNQAALFTEAEFRNPSDKIRTWKCYVVFFDKEGKLLGGHKAQGDHPLDADSVRQTPCLVLSAWVERMAEQVASYKLTYLEFEIEEFKPTGGSDGRPGLRSPVLQLDTGPR